MIQNGRIDQATKLTGQRTSIISEILLVGGADSCTFPWHGQDSYRALVGMTFDQFTHGCMSVNIFRNHCTGTRGIGRGVVRWLVRVFEKAHTLIVGPGETQEYSVVEMSTNTLSSFLSDCGKVARKSS